MPSGLRAATLSVVPALAVQKWQFPPKGGLTIARPLSTGFLLAFCYDGGKILKGVVSKTAPRRLEGYATMFHRPWNHILSVLQKTWEGWREDDGFLLSAAMAYYAAFSLFPLCLVLISILGFVLHFSQQAGNAQAFLLEQVKQQMGPWLADRLLDLLAGVKSSAGLGGPLGAMTLLAAAIVVFLQLDYMFDRIFGATKTSSTASLWGYVRTVLYDRLWAFLMLMAVGALLLGLFIANVILTGVRPRIEHALPVGVAIGGWAQFLFTTTTNALLFAVIYKVLPKVAIPWRDALSGGLLVSLVWILGQRLLVTFLIGSSYTAYGIVGSFIAVMIWLYYVSAILFLGAEFVEALSIVSGRSTRLPKS
jgi:membrane protein